MAAAAKSDARKERLQLGMGAVVAIAAVVVAIVVLSGGGGGGGRHRRGATDEGPESHLDHADRQR